MKIINPFEKIDFHYSKLFKKFIIYFNLDKILINIPSKFKIFLRVFSDFLILIFSLYITNHFFNSINLFNNNGIGRFQICLIITIISLITYYLNDQYRSITRYVNSLSIYNLLIQNLFVFIPIFILNKFFLISDYNFKFFIFLFLVVSGLISFKKVLIRDFLIIIDNSLTKQLTKVAIYGAGSAGAQLAKNIELNKNYKLIAFFDDSKKLHNRYLFGVKINSPKKLNLYQNQIDQILLAIPSISAEKKRKILLNLQSFEIRVMQIPSLEEITDESRIIDNLCPIKLNELLPRNSVKPISDLLEKNIKNSEVLITGAGGSIGREIAIKVYDQIPKKIILVDNNEPSIYSIYEELKILDKKNVIEIVPILCDVTNNLSVKNILKNNNIDIIFHAAAYKHVPLVEINPIPGIYNNVFSTEVICSAAIEHKIKNVVVISTDKAVRPTNVMGATKRLAELVLQAYQKVAKNKNISTKFCLVRFGNVLGSSGSVVPLFEKQIARGGPVTLTHKKIIRYFMTIPEAAELVIQASSLATGGEVFLLDMGEPVNIYDLAKLMIKLSGKTVKSKDNPFGNIEIIFNGLRAGEKLFEELLIDSESQSTIHPLIFKANEKFIAPEKLFPLIRKLKKHTIANQKTKSLMILKQIVKEWEMSNLI